MQEQQSLGVFARLQALLLSSDEEIKFRAFLIVMQVTLRNMMRSALGGLQFQGVAVLPLADGLDPFISHLCIETAGRGRVPRHGAAERCPGRSAVPGVILNA